MEEKTMSETLKVLEERRSCRAYKPELIEEEKLQKIIEAGTYAATGMGKQSPIIIAVTNKELRDRLSVINGKIMGMPENVDPFYGAPELLIVLADKAVPTYLYDGSLVMGNLMIAAEDLGVNSCWIHRAKEEFESPEGKEILRKLGVEGDYEGIGHLVLGYADGPLKAAAPRKADYVYYIR
jgi:nitroreductase